MNWIVLIYAFGAFAGGSFIGLIIWSAVQAYKEANEDETTLTDMSHRVDVEKALFRARIDKYKDVK